MVTGINIREIKKRREGSMKNEAQNMYDVVMKIIAKGNNVEIQKKPDGSIRIYEIKRKTVTQ